jgi:hypothetical protein
VADNPVIDNGGGGGANFTAATDEVGVNGGSVAHVQYVKLVDGTSNGTDGIPGTAGFGLEVDVSRIVPGTGATNLGKAEDTAHADGDVGVLMLGVRNHTTGSTADGDYSAMSVSPTGDLNTVGRRDGPTISVASAGLTIATTAYTAGDQMGTIFTLPNAARVSGGSGIITGVKLIDAADVIGPVDVMFFDRSVTLAADNAAFAISDADALFIVGLAQLSGAFDIGNNRLAQQIPAAIPYTCNGTSLFAAVITRSGHTFFGATGNLQLIVNVERY